MDRPYVPPTSNYGGGLPGRVSPRVVDIMSRTKGWVRFIAVLLFINFGLTIINTVVVVNGSETRELAAGRIGQFIGFAIVLLLYLYPAIKLNSYASRIGALLQSGRTGDLEAALNEHRAFWRYVGIVMIVLMSILVLVFFISILAAASGSRF